MASNSQPTKHLDPQARIELDALQSADEPSLYLKLIEIFLRTSDGFLTDLKRMDQLKNFELVADIAHSWKSSAAGIGARSLAGLCAQLEGLGNQDVPRASSLVKAIESEFAEVRRELLEVSVKS
jgi:HPt (histidine-containing phosphotransfer) domain-containing protein